MADTHHADKLMESDDMFGFIVMDGEGTLFGTLSGNTRQVLYMYRLFPPKKHGRGGEPALRFSRAHFLKHINHGRKTDELASMLYIDPNTRQPNVCGLILAGSVEYKTRQLVDIIDPLLKEKIVNVVDVSYGEENGLNQAIELSSGILSKPKFAKE
ncbi:putative peptide chain release factor eRF1/aRF1 [Medicago truncatula]|uniref:Eukaryotic peptide chain release factor subunit 1-3 n=1 Tax=Medicago truncatula TaxID=3880 RepID=G7KLR1_MEDTR|nr:eukaryotic peptide chain release factor subunit 1-2 [Medicago truncatula]AES76540.1 eukaryotic peptide chain release factor subunit 1-3 [Medicago truncatula]RHN52508.1 putative peptide chain release factor eRF1/aRF1 [Medicago truncatula]